MWDLLEKIHKALGTESTFIFVLTVALVFAVLSGGAAWLFDRGYKNAHKPPQVAVEWHHAAPPVFPPSGRIYVLQAWPVPIENGGGGLPENIGTPGQTLAWPVTLDTLQCQITNYSPGAIFNIVANLHLTFRQAVKDKEYPTQTRSGDVLLSRDWPVYISKIDAGADHAFVFYVANFKDDVFVEVSFPNSITGQIWGGEQRRTIDVVQPPLIPMINSLPPFWNANPKN